MLSSGFISTLAERFAALHDGRGPFADLPFRSSVLNSRGLKV
jgi:hypothetical protein